MRKAALIILAFAGVLAVSTVVMSQSPVKGQPAREFTRSQQGRLLGVLNARKEKLKITDEQLAQIKDLQMKMEEKRVEHQNTANTQRLEFKKWRMDTEERDYAALRTLLNKSSQARTDMLISQMQLRDQIFNILTEEQREALRANGRNPMRHGRGFIREQGHRPPMRFPRSGRFFRQSRFTQESDGSH